MTITTQEKRALNNLPKYVPALAADQTDGVELALGDVIETIQTSQATDVTALKTAAVVTAVADVSATAAADAAVTAVADVSATAAADAAVTALVDATDDATVWALANDLKAKYNAAVTLINELKADLGEARALANDLKAKYNASVTLMNESKADHAESRALANDLKAKYNALVAGIDAL